MIAEECKTGKKKVRRYKNTEKSESENQMSGVYCLNDIKPGEWAYIDRLESTGNMRRRMLDIGLVRDTRVECVGKSPSGDPCAFLIRGAVIAIRSEDCRNILIKA